MNEDTELMAREIEYFEDAVIRYVRTVLQEPTPKNLDSLRRVLNNLDEAKAEFAKATGSLTAPRT